MLGEICAGALTADRRSDARALAVLLNVQAGDVAEHLGVSMGSTALLAAGAVDAVWIARRVKPVRKVGQTAVERAGGLCYNRCVLEIYTVKCSYIRRRRDRAPISRAFPGAHGENQREL